MTGAALALAALTAAAPPAHALSSGNLIVNGDAASGLCTTTGLDTTTLPGWTITSGGPDSVCYGAPGGYPSRSTPGASSTSSGFFAGGTKGNASMRQAVNVSSASTAINGGGVGYTLSGGLGGYASQDDRVGVVAAFLNGSGSTLGTTSLAPVTNTQRGNTTEFVPESATGTVPAGTVKVQVTVSWTWTSGNSRDGYLSGLSLTLNTAVTAPVLTPPSSNVPHFDHVFFVYMENENENSSLAPANSGDYIVGNPSAPYLNKTVAPMGALLADTFATQHPSDPNYLAVTGGSPFNATVNLTKPGQYSDTNLADRLNAAGLSWKGYAEGMNGNCDLTDHGYYYYDDDAFLDYADNTTPVSYCAAHNQPLTQLATDLQSTSTTPAFSWVVADDYSNMEQGGVPAGDSWLSSTLPQIFNSPAWTTQRSLLVITWDEGYAKSYGPSYPNQVASYVAASQGLVKAGYTSTNYYDHYSLLATIDQALGLKPLTTNDQYAQSIDDIWNG